MSKNFEQEIFVSELENNLASSNKIDLKWIPEGVLGQLLFLGILPFILLFFTAAVVFSTGTILSPYFPFIALIGLCAAIRWKSKGIIVSSVLMISVFWWFEDRVNSGALVWQIGLSGSLILNWFIALMCVEEITTSIIYLEDEVKNVKEIHVSTSQAHQVETESWRKEWESLQDEIRKWKEEAEQRKIEKETKDRHLSMVQTEMNQLFLQKEMILSESFESRSIAQESKTKLEDFQKEYAQMKLDFEPLRAEKERLAAHLDEFRLQLTLSQNDQNQQQETIYHLRQKELDLTLEIENLSKQHAFARVELEKLHVDEKEKEQQQLHLLQTERNQKEEMIQVLRHELESIRQCLIEKEITLQQLQERCELLLSEKSLLEQDKEKLLQVEKKQKEEAIQALRQELGQELSEKERTLKQLQEKYEELLSDKNRLNFEKEELIQKLSQIEIQNSQVPSVIPADETVQLQSNVELSKENARVLGLYHQLRTQFEEKSRVLSQTRKDFFRIQGKILMQEIENTLQPFDFKNDPTQQQLALLFSEMHQMELENKRLEEEISSLEALISHILSQ